MDEKLFAYSLNQVEQGWTWSLWDEDGDVVAAGAAPDQHSAQHLLTEAIRQTRDETSPEQMEPAPLGRPTPSPRSPRRRQHSSLPQSQLAAVRPHHRQGR